MPKMAVTTASGNLGAAIVKATAELFGKEHVIGIARESPAQALAFSSAVHTRTPAKAESLGVEYIDTYNERGEIANCAGDAKCGYTTRPELAYAYARMLTESEHDGQTYNLHGEAISQQELAGYLSAAFDTDLKYRPMSAEEYREDRIAELGEFLSLGGNFPANARTYVFIGFNACLMLAVSGVLLFRRKLPLAMFVCLLLILSGGIGNLIDRVTNDGLVTDFIIWALDQCAPASSISPTLP